MIGMAVVGLMGVARFSVAEVHEYLAVAHNRISAAASEQIPLSVEIDRMEVLVQKLDTQVRSHATRVAKSQIALEDGEIELSKVEARCSGIIDDLTVLRAACEDPTQYVMVNTTCRGEQRESIDRTTVAKALEHKVAEWNVQRSESKARQSAVDAQRGAFRKLQGQFTQWKLQKELLGHRLESLKARYTAQQLLSLIHI